MSNRHDLTEYRFSKQVSEDFPSIIKWASEFKRKLRPYKKYVAVKNIMDAIDQSMESLLNNLDYYDKIKTKKGIKDE